MAMRKELKQAPGETRRKETNVEKNTTANEKLPIELQEIRPDSLPAFLKTINALSDGACESDEIYVLSPETPLYSKFGKGRWHLSEQNLTRSEKKGGDGCVWLYNSRVGEYYAPLLWFDPSGQPWEAQTDIMISRSGDISDFHFSSWEKVSGIVGVQSPAAKTAYHAAKYYYVINPPQEMEMILLSVAPEAYKFLKRMPQLDTENGIFTPASLLMAPQIQKLYEWGYRAFTEKHMDFFVQGDFDALNRLTRPGDTEEEAVLAPSYVRKKMKNDVRPCYWFDDFGL